MSSATNNIEALHNEVRLLLEKQYSNESIVKELQQRGLEPYYIETIISNIENAKADSKSFRNCMIMGGFYMASGLLLNIFSYQFAERTNSTYFYIFLGTIVLGIITIARGYIIYKQ